MVETKIFKQHFREYACEGDSLSAAYDGFELTAQLLRDDTSTAPDTMQDGFWPSLDPKDAGYIGDGKTAAQFTAAKRRASHIMNAWKNDEWFYCGIIVKASRCGVILSSASLWGIECNYPTGKNRYLRQVANELADEAINAAEDKLHELLNKGGK